MTKEELRAKVLDNLPYLPPGQQAKSAAILLINQESCLSCRRLDGVGFYYWKADGMDTLTQMCSDCVTAENAADDSGDELVQVLPDDA